MGKEIVHEHEELDVLFDSYVRRYKEAMKKGLPAEYYFLKLEVLDRLGLNVWIKIKENFIDVE